MRSRHVNNVWAKNTASWKSAKPSFFWKIDEQASVHACSDETWIIKNRRSRKDLPVAIFQEGQSREIICIIFSTTLFGQPWIKYHLYIYILLKCSHEIAICYSVSPLMLNIMEPMLVKMDLRKYLQWIDRKFFFLLMINRTLVDKYPFFFLFLFLSK